MGPHVGHGEKHFSRLRALCVNSLRRTFGGVRMYVCVDVWVCRCVGVYICVCSRARVMFNPYMCLSVCSVDRSMNETPREEEFLFLFCSSLQRRGSPGGRSDAITIRQSARGVVKAPRTQVPEKTGPTRPERGAKRDFSKPFPRTGGPANLDGSRFCHAHPTLSSPHAPLFRATCVTYAAR
ncbi:hypothetical protein L209DRAFT_616106 [Thermothelomyces heterothallicus CBS 203.75]